MKGALFIMMLIALLVVGALVIKNMKSGEGVKEADKTEIVKKAERTADRAQKTLDKTAKSVEEAMGKMEDAAQ